MSFKVGDWVKYHPRYAVCDSAGRITSMRDDIATVMLQTGGSGVFLLADLFAVPCPCNLPCYIEAGLACKCHDQK